MNSYYSLWMIVRVVCMSIFMPLVQCSECMFSFSFIPCTTWQVEYFEDVKARSVTPNLAKEVRQIILLLTLAKLSIGVSSYRIGAVLQMSSVFDLLHIVWCTSTAPNTSTFKADDLCFCMTQRAHCVPRWSVTVSILSDSCTTCVRRCELVFVAFVSVLYRNPSSISGGV